MDLTNFTDFLNEGKYDKDLATINNMLQSTRHKDKPPQTEEDLFSKWDKKKKGTYEVYELDMDGRHHIRTIGYYKADSEAHARAKAAIDLNNLEIYMTGFYGSDLIDQSKKIKELELQLSGIQKALANIKNAK